MRLASGTVLGLAAAASSPALWQGLVTRELPVDLALTRFLIAAVAVWAALSVVVALVGAPAIPVRAAAAAVDPTGPADEPAAAD